MEKPPPQAGQGAPQEALTTRARTCEHCAHDTHACACGQCVHCKQRVHVWTLWTTVCIAYTCTMGANAHTAGDCSRCARLSTMMAVCMHACNRVQCAHVHAVLAMVAAGSGEYYRFRLGLSGSRVLAWLGIMHRGCPAQGVASFFLIGKHDGNKE